MMLYEPQQVRLRNHGSNTKEQIMPMTKREIINLLHEKAGLTRKEYIGDDLYPAILEIFHCKSNELTFWEDFPR